MLKTSFEVLMFKSKKTRKKQKGILQEETLMGNYPYLPFVFRDTEAKLSALGKKGFTGMPEHTKLHAICMLLVSLIRQEPIHVFLLPAVTHFLSEVNQKALLLYPISIRRFELWLNHHSEISQEENYLIRAKIVGKFIPRADYQLYFPIGMNKVYQGSHFIAAHKSPDLDTSVASFMSWMDSFGARVCQGRHVWAYPEEKPLHHIAKVFETYIGEPAFRILSKTTARLMITARDLMTQEGVEFKTLDNSCDAIAFFSSHAMENKKAIIIIDKQGFYRGEWREEDSDAIRQITVLFNDCLRSYSSKLYIDLITFFSESGTVQSQLKTYLHDYLNLCLEEIAPVQEYTSLQKDYLHRTLVQLFNLKEGLRSSFNSFIKAALNKGLKNFKKLDAKLKNLTHLNGYDKKGNVKREFFVIFKLIKDLMVCIDEAFLSLRTYLESVQVALDIKYKVLEWESQYVMVGSDIEEVKQVIKPHSYVTVVTAEKENELHPVGVIYARDMENKHLGTVSMRDFCNYEETSVGPKLAVISVVDHHKSVLSTSSVCTAHIRDVQSCNVLLANMAMEINDQYSTYGMRLADVEKEIEKWEKSSDYLASFYVLNKLYQIKKVLLRELEYWICPERELVEYLMFLHAIIDDTDLLVKVTDADVICVSELLNRIKSIMSSKVVELISLEDVPKDSTFSQKAAARILENDETYSFYSKIYAFKEKEITKHLKLAASGEDSDFFIDTKEQNGCCRVGQSKIFSQNRAIFTSLKPSLYNRWAQKAKAIYANESHLAVHLHMISTVFGAQEAYEGKGMEVGTQDELWVWIPEHLSALELLSTFITGLSHAPELIQEKFEASVYGGRAMEIKNLLERQFKSITVKAYPKTKSGPVLILRYRVTLLNSRKSMITPYLPKLSSR